MRDRTGKNGAGQVKEDKKMAKAKSLETAFEELDALIEQMENKDTSLEESFKIYSSGMKLIQYCNDALDKVEKKMIVLEQEKEDE